MEEITKEKLESLKKRLYERIHTTGEEIKLDFPKALRTAIRLEAWKHFTDATGKPFKDLVSWLHYSWPAGTSMGRDDCSLSYQDAMKLCEGYEDVHKVLCDNAPNRGRGGDKKSKKAKKDQKGVRPFDRGSSGGSRKKEVLQVRLAQEHPEHFEKLQKGEYKSVRAAAEASGLTKPSNDPVKRSKSYLKKLSAEEQFDVLRYFWSLLDKKVRADFEFWIEEVGEDG